MKNKLFVGFLELEFDLQQHDRLLLRKDDHSLGTAIQD